MEPAPTAVEEPLNMVTSPHDFNAISIWGGSSDSQQVEDFSYHGETLGERVGAEQRGEEGVWVEKQISFLLISVQRCLISSRAYLQL